MRLFLTILEGSTPSDAVPILATEDQAVIQDVARTLVRRLGLNAPKARVLALEARRPHPAGEHGGE